MVTSTLRNVGGSVMMTIPKPILEGLGLSANEKVALTISEGRLIVEARPRPKYALSELLAQCDSSAPQRDDLKEWDETAPVGREII